MKRLLALAALVLLGGFLIGACASTDNADSAGSAGDQAGADQPGADQPGVAMSEPFGGSTDSRLADTGGQPATAQTGDKAAQTESGPQTVLTGAQMIRTGAVALRSDDVDTTRIEVLEVVDRLRGEVADDQTQTDAEGQARNARLTLRIPSSDFQAAVEEIKTLAQLKSASTNAEDVTQQWIDTRSRLAVQRASIKRVTALLERATSIGDVVAIESELSSRQATLDSLEQQMRYLADQTSMSTITVSIARTDLDPAPETEDATGFWAGLQRGWDNLMSATETVATGLGLLLPFVVAAGILAVPGWLLWRAATALVRRLRRTGGSAGAA